MNDEPHPEMQPSGPDISNTMKLYFVGIAAIAAIATAVVSNNLSPRPQMKLNHNHPDTKILVRSKADQLLYYKQGEYTNLPNGNIVYQDQTFTNLTAFKSYLINEYDKIFISLSKP